MSRNNRCQIKSDGILSKIGVNASMGDSLKLSAVLELTSRLSDGMNVDRSFI
jgi:hypothetical protein